MQRIVEFFIKNETAGNLIMVLIFVGGIFGLLNMKTTFFPETESRFIAIQAVYPGASPEEIEEGIVLKIEDNLKGVTGIERVTSVSNENLGSVTVEVDRDYDTDLVLQDVKNAVDQISSFPARMEPPTVAKRENLSFAISFALSGDVDLRMLKKTARRVEDDLRAFDFLSKVELSGFPDEEIEISFRERDLQAYNMTFAEAAAAVGAANLEITGGTVKGDEEELLLRARNKEYYANEMRNIPVRTAPNGTVIALWQVADVRDKWADSPDRSYLNGEPSVVVTIQNTIAEDMLQITDAVKEYLEDFNATNTQVQATIIRDGSVTLNQRIALLRDNGLIGFALVLILLAMFLHWRLAFWVALAIPISFAGMFAVANLLGTTINVVSLFGMILVVGILVDDGIVIAENIYQKYEQGLGRMEAAIQGTMEVLPAVFAAILTTVIAFSIFFFIEGRLGDIFFDMATVVILSLVFSLVEGAIILPAHVAHSKALKAGATKAWAARKLDDFMYWMRDTLYAPVLRFVMNYPLAGLVVPVAVMLITIGAMAGGVIRFTFFPVIPRDNITVSLRMPAGTRDYITEEVLRQIQLTAWDVNDKLSDEYYDGEQEPIEKIELKVGPNTYTGQLDISLLDGEARGDLTSREIGRRIREAHGEVFNAEQLTFGGATAFGKAVSISLLAEDAETLDNVAESLKSELATFAELKDVETNNQEGLREINIKLKPKAYYLGLNVRDVIAQVRAGFFGSEIQRLQRGLDEVKVWVRYDQSDRSSVGKLEDMRIRFADGREFPLREIATFEMERGISSINHLDGAREVKVEADIANDKVDVPVILTRIRENIMPQLLADNPSVSVLYEGQNREQQRSMESIQKIMPVIFILMFFVIALTFKSVTQAMAVFALIPFGLIGVGWGHWLRDAPISLFSVLGIIALVGVLVNDALVFVSAFNDNLKSGMPFRESLFEAGKSRFRPIVLTTVTTVAGLLPLIGEKSFQAQFLIPMAISVAFGLLFVTVIILLLLPSLLMIINHIKVYSTQVWTGHRPAPELMEPAVEGRTAYGFAWTVGGLLAIAAFVGVVYGVMMVFG